MRPVDKGIAPKQYTNYQNSRSDLAQQIGWYCSYCEMPVKNMIEVEHVVPVKNGGKKLEWHNFLLSCRYCNSVKVDRNTSRKGYFWPDIDNTFLAFSYSPVKMIEPNNQLTSAKMTIAQNTIDLMGLDRYPGAINEPTEKDTRWRSFDEAWGKAQRALERWHKLPVPLMLEQIIDTAKGTGHFSIWMAVFKNEIVVKQAFIQEFTGTAKNCFVKGNPVSRRGSNL
jgi:hypothetical protein